MPLSPSFARSIVSVALGFGMLATGCALGSQPSSPPSSRKQQTNYATWELDTLGELDQLLNVKGCEGWRLAEAFARGDKIIAILVHEGVEPPPANAACRLPA